MNYFWTSFFALIAWVAVVPAAHAQFVCTVTHGTVVDSVYFYYEALSCKGNNCIVTSQMFPDTNGHYGHEKFASLRSTNGGHMWSVADMDISDPSNVGFPYIDQIDSDNVVAYDPQGVIIRTTDGGATWQQDSVPIKGQINDLTFSSQANGMIVAGYDIYLTSDSGLNWDTIPFPNGWISRGHDYGNGRYRGYNWYTMRTYSTTDAWKSLDSTAPIFADPKVRGAYLLDNVAFGSGDTMLAYGEHYNSNPPNGGPSIVRTTDGGNHWTPVFDDTADSSYVNSLSDVNRDTIVAGITGWLNKTIWSTDNGATWEIDSLLCSDTNFVGFQNDGIGLNSEGELVGAFNSAFDAVTHTPTKNSLIIGRHVSSRVKKEDRTNSVVNLFPNPTATSITLTGAVAGGTLHLLDILGREVLSGKVPASGTLTLDVSHLPRGIYAVMLEKNGQMLPAGKLVLEGN